MHDSETRSLKRAALVLLAASCLRIGWGRWDPPPPGNVEDVLPELVTATTAARSEADRRSRPLSEGERIDPNRADAAELDRLPGVGPSLAREIVAARDMGVVFRRPDDLAQVRGIGPALVERARGSLDFPSPPVRRRDPAYRPKLVDLNRADGDALQRLPGIGPALAERIVAARREQLFRTLDDLERVEGIGPATLRRIRSLATVGSAP